MRTLKRHLEAALNDALLHVAAARGLTVAPSSDARQFQVEGVVDTHPVRVNRSEKRTLLSVRLAPHVPSHLHIARRQDDPGLPLINPVLHRLACVRSPDAADARRASRLDPGLLADVLHNHTGEVLAGSVRLRLPAVCTRALLGAALSAATAPAAATNAAWERSSAVVDS